MKRIITLLLATILLVSCIEEQRPVKIACVGDSITFGAKIKNREANSYPQQLQSMLGDGYDVRNFGVSGSTALTGSDRSYVGKSAFRDMMNFAPDVVLLKLGTNDSNIALRSEMGRFEECYNAIIDSIYSVSPKCRVVLLAPIKAHNPISQWGIDSTYIEKSILPRVQQIAYQRDLEVVNLYPMFDKYEEYLMPDRVHPSALGAAKIARRLYELLTLPTTKYTFDKELKERHSFHGFSCYEFDFEGNTSRVAVPRVVAKGKPWVMRARFWGNKNFYHTDVALLERGFHILYTDVTDLYGSPEAVRRLTRFIDYAASRGLNERCVIEALSRGGLVGYNYALQQPERVALLYGDAPVLDFNSWPIGFKPEGVDTRKLLKAYGFESCVEAAAYGANPLDNAAQIAHCGFDMMHVCGDADDVVPMTQNTLPFIKRVEATGGKVKLIVKEGVGHHPHGLVNPEPIVEQILISTGQFASPTTVPTQGAEYRQMSDWVSISNEITEMAAAQKYDILLLGNSITQGFGGERKLVRYKPGNEAMTAAFPNHTWLGAGIAGDRTEHLLYRILNGGYELCEPKYVVLTIGINNLFSGEDSAEDTFNGIVACTEAATKKMPNAKIILYGTLPAERFIEECSDISNRLANHKWSSKVTYVDPFEIFANGQTASSLSSLPASINVELYNKDHLHLSKRGYEAWCANLKLHLK
ncbi:MAG: GDSL-type esterase/lipase family protein [Rikenellaceae bacterium]